MQRQRWSKQDKSLVDILQTHANCFPFRIKISQGYCQEDVPEELAFCTGDIYEVKEVQTRRTILVATKAGTEYTIDETDDRQFLVVTKNGPEGPVGLRHILENYPLNKLTLVPEFDRARSRTSLASGSLPRCIRDSELKVIKCYRERFLSANLILEDSAYMNIGDQPALMPLGVGIRAHTEMAEEIGAHNDKDESIDAKQSQFLEALGLANPQDNHKSGKSSKPSTEAGAIQRRTFKPLAALRKLGKKKREETGLPYKRSRDPTKKARRGEQCDGAEAMPGSSGAHGEPHDCQEPVGNPEQQQEPHVPLPALSLLIENSVGESSSGSKASGSSDTNAPKGAYPSEQCTAVQSHIRRVRSEYIRVSPATDHTYTNDAAARAIQAREPGQVKAEQDPDPRPVRAAHAHEWRPVRAGSAREVGPIRADQDHEGGASAVIGWGVSVSPTPERGVVRCSSPRPSPEPAPFASDAAGGLCESSSLPSASGSNASLSSKPSCTVKPRVHNEYITLVQGQGQHSDTTRNGDENEGRAQHNPPQHHSADIRGHSPAISGSTIEDQYLTMNHTNGFRPYYVNQIEYIRLRNMQSSNIPLGHGMYITLGISAIGELNEENRPPIHTIFCNHNAPMPPIFDHGMYLTIRRSRETRPLSVDSGENLEGILILPSQIETPLSTQTPDNITHSIHNHRFSFSNSSEVSTSSSSSLNGSTSSHVKESTSGTDGDPDGRNTPPTDQIQSRSDPESIPQNNSASSSRSDSSNKSGITNTSTCPDGSDPSKVPVPQSSAASMAPVTVALSTTMPSSFKPENSNDNETMIAPPNIDLKSCGFNLQSGTPDRRMSEFQEQSTKHFQSGSEGVRHQISLRLSSSENLPVQGQRGETQARNYRTTEENTASSYSSSDVYGSLTEVCTSFSAMSISELACCLRLLKMPHHARTFEANQIDGHLAKRLNKDILVNEFKFSEFEALKFEEFTRGWRPKKI